MTVCLIRLKRTKKTWTLKFEFNPRRADWVKEEAAKRQDGGNPVGGARGREAVLLIASNFEGVERRGVSRDPGPAPRNSVNDDLRVANYTVRPATHTAFSTELRQQGRGRRRHRRR